MDGHTKSGSFPLLLQGKLIPVSVKLNEMTKFAKLQVGKHIVTAKHTEGSKNYLFPLLIAINDPELEPLKKVCADYEANPKN